MVPRGGTQSALFAGSLQQYRHAKRAYPNLSQPSNLVIPGDTPVTGSRRQQPTHNPTRKIRKPTTRPALATHEYSQQPTPTGNANTQARERTDHNVYTMYHLMHARGVKPKGERARAHSHTYTMRDT